MSYNGKVGDMTLVLPSPELQVHIRRELNEDVSTRDRDLEMIREWLRKQPHLPQTMSDLFLMNFLRGCSFSIEKCKRKIDMYYTMRTACPEFFTNRDIKRPELQSIVKIACAAVLPGLTPDGKRVTILRARQSDFETPYIGDAMKLAFMTGDVRILEERFGVTGDVYILDASVAIMKHFVKIPPSVVKKFLICVQEAYPVKLKEVHIVNPSAVIDFIVTSVKPFLKEKIKKRIQVHHELETLHQFVPKEILPKLYGGVSEDLEDLQMSWEKKLDEYSPWFKEQEDLKADESKRPGKPTNYNDLFGLEGSFKQLNID